MIFRADVRPFVRFAAAYPALAADEGVCAAQPREVYSALRDARLPRTPSQQKRRALGSLARSPRQPPYTAHFRFGDLGGSAPRAPPPGDPPARAASIKVPRLRRASQGFPVPLRPCSEGMGPRQITAVSSQVPPRAGSGAGRFAHGGRGGPAPRIWRSSARRSTSVRVAQTSRGGPPRAPPPCHPLQPCVRSVSARYLTRACC